ncbi:hypothetical protein ABTI40_19650, partial [Acinetobacter baumannii]
DEVSELDEALRKAHSGLIAARLKQKTMLNRLSLEMRDPLLQAISDEERLSKMMGDSLQEKAHRYLANSRKGIGQVLDVL